MKSSDEEIIASDVKDRLMGASNTRQTILENIQKLGGVKDEDVDNIWWLHGHCLMLFFNSESKSWELEEL